MANNSNPKLSDVVALFMALPTEDADDVVIVGVPGSEAIATHVQGVARYGTGYVMTHSNLDGKDGCLLVDDGDRTVKKFPITEGSINGLHLSHPGGCQRMGDYLVVGIESIPAGKNVSRIVFFDISNPAQPVKLTTPTPIERNDQKAGCVGIANLTVQGTEFWFLGLYDNGRVDLHRSDGQPFPTTEFSFQFTDRIPDGYEGFCLVAEESNRLFAVGFRRDSRLRNKAELYEVHLDTQKLELLESREFHPKLIGDANFRWGSGVDIAARDELVVLATGRNFLPICHVNSFVTKPKNVAVHEPTD
jgi:hypothetical protein